MTTGEIEQHGDWLIWYAPPPIECRDFDWHFAHKDACHSDGRYGDEPSREICLQSIDYIDEQDAIAETEEGKARSQAFVDNAMRLYNRALLAQSVKRLLDLPGIGNLPGAITGNAIGAARHALEQYQEQTK